MTTAAEPDRHRGWFRRRLHRLDWRANPVLVRDLRLYMRGRALLSAYFLTLAALVLCGIAYAVSTRWQDDGGQALLAVPTYLLTLLCGALIPNMVGERFRGELASRATELALASALSPARLVRGKLMGAWALSLLVASLAMPVLAAAYLLGGVSPWQPAVLVGGALAAGATAPTLFLYLATGGQRGGLLRLVDSAALVGMAVAMLCYAPLLLHVAESPDAGLVMTLVSLLLFALLIAVFLHQVTVSRLRSEAEDRETRPRLALGMATALGWLATLGVVYAGERWKLGLPGVKPWMLTAAASACIAYPFAWGIYVVSHGNAARPRLAPPDRGFLRRWLGGGGPGGVTACFWIGAVAILAAGLPGCFASTLRTDGMMVACFLLAPLTATGYGLAAYHYAVRPLAKTPPGPGRLAATIMVVNVALALPGYFFVRILSLGLPGSGDGVLALFPVGIFLGGLSKTTAMERVGPGLTVMMVLLALLLVPALKAMRRPGDAAP